MCSRILLTLARDFATPQNESKSGYQFVNGISEITPITLWEFLVKLTGLDETLNLEIKSPFEDTQTQATHMAELRGWATHVYLNFTHFVQAKETINIVSLDCLYGLWLRGAAIQCAFNQPVIDGLLVGYHSDLDVAFDKSNLLMVAFQVKNRGGSGSSAAGPVAPFISKPRKDEPGVEDYYKSMPNLVILMDFGCSAKFRGPHGATMALNKTKPDVSTKKWLGYNLKEGEEERFCLIIRGHDSESYPVIEPSAESFKLLFGQMKVGEMPAQYNRWEQNVSRAETLY